MNKDNVDIVAKLEADPGDPIFAAHANSLREEGALDKALFVCLAGLSSNPACHQGRLVLARIFYEQGFHPFALREVERLHHDLPKNEAVRRLLEAISPDQVAPEGAAEDRGKAEESADEATVAEAEFDFDVLEEMMDED